MLIVRRVPRRAAGIDAGVVALETATAAAVAHVVAGGGTPDVGSLASLLALAVLGYGAGLAVLGRGSSIRVVAPSMVAAQLFLHAWWAGTPGGHGAHGGHGAPAGTGAGGALDGLAIGPLVLPALPEASMLAAHVAAGVVAAGAWALRRRAVDLLVRWTAEHVLPVPHPVAITPGDRVAAPVARVLVRIAPSRGPPRRLGIAAA